MRIGARASISLVSLMMIATACSKPEEVTQSVAPLEGADQPIVVQPSVGDEVSADQSLTSARLETCEPNEAVDLRIRELEVRLSELRIAFTERHPDVVAIRQRLDELERQALDECVERLQ